MSRIGRGDAYTIIENDLKRLGVKVELAQERYGDDIAGYVARKATNLIDGMYPATRSLSKVRDYLRSVAPGSRQWHVETVRTLLRHETYRGIIRYGPNVNLNAFEAILPKELTDVVDAALKEPVRAVRTKYNPEVRKDPNTYYVRGLVFCAACGCRMTPKAAHGRKGRVPYYECTAGNKGAPCPVSRVNANALHAGILKEIHRQASARP